MVHFTAPAAPCPDCGAEAHLARGLYRCPHHGAWSLSVEPMGAWDFAARLVPA
jgi:hypothetical protein